MRTTNQTFVITAPVPAGVSVGEFASHLADAHRLAVGGYHASDPMSVAAAIEVLGTVPSCGLPGAGA